MGKRQQARDQVERRIIELGRAHLATDGAAGLSLRAIARDLGMVSSAVYRYVASRDDLLTLLLVDAYDELADAVDAARASAAAGVRDQLSAVARAARTWALARPECWALLYGSPVPGYRAPAERTVGPGTRVVAALFAVMAAAPARDPSDGPVPQQLSADFDRLRAEFGVAVDDAAMQRCLVLWAALIGAISLEVFGQYGADTFTDPDVVFDRQIDVLVGLVTSN